METSLASEPCGGSLADEIVGGLLLRLSDDEARRRDAITQLSGHPAVTCGEPNGHWLPIAVSATDQRSSRDLHHWLSTIPGVDWVEVVSVHYTPISRSTDS